MLKLICLTEGFNVCRLNIIVFLFCILMFCAQYLNNFYNNKINNIDNIKSISIFLVIFSIIGIIISCLKYENVNNNKNENEKLIINVV